MERAVLEKEKIPSRKITMSLILSLGSNLGNRANYLTGARNELKNIFQEKKASHIYESEAVDYTHQPPFLNQVIEYERPPMSPHEVLKIILTMEKNFHRTRTINKGPRTLDIDLIFFGSLKVSSPDLQIPHPLWAHRAFIYWPLHELPGFKNLKSLFFQSKLSVVNNTVLFNPAEDALRQRGIPKSVVAKRP